MQLHASATALLAPLGKAATQMTSTHLGEPSLRWLQEALDSPIYQEVEDEESTEDVTNEND